jgi:L-lactate transport
MWTQIYDPVAGNLGLSALVAALPVFVLLLALAVFHIPAWKSSLLGLAAAVFVAWVVYGMPLPLLANSILYGAAFGLFPIGWIVYAAIVLYRVTVETGQFEIIKNSVGSITSDHRLQALLIAFSFGAFLEGASGFGTPVAVAAAMLAGLGFEPFYAASICLLANTAPVAFGAIATPIVTLAGITGLPLPTLSAWVGQICAPVSLFIPAYLILVMGGLKALRVVFPAAAVCGIAFASTQFLVSNYVGAYLTDILSSSVSIVALMILLRVWTPSDHAAGTSRVEAPPAAATFRAWSPYLLLVTFVSLWGSDGVKKILNGIAAWNIQWPGLHNQILRVAPAVLKPTPYAAVFSFNVLSAAGTACLFAAICAALVLRMPHSKFVRILGATARQLAFPLLTIAVVLALAYLMNYCGATATLGLAFAATGVLFPFFSAVLGWLGVFLTGSDTSANALFGNLQVVTATKLHLNPALMAAANSSGGVMGKMISLQSIAVAAAATGMAAKDEARLFRFTLRHSMILTATIGVVVMIYAYLRP